jgi:hypothetical protein
MYPSQKKDICHLSTIKRGHIGVKGDTIEKIQLVTNLLIKKRALSFQTI